MKRFWIAENFRGQGYWVECPNLAKAVERFGEEAVAISFRERGAEYALILYPDGVFHITAGGGMLEIHYDRRAMKWYYRDMEYPFIISLSRETLSKILFYSREMLHK